MEKTKCPYCDQQISHQAKKCPFCQEWLVSSWQELNIRFRPLYVLLIALVTYSTLLLLNNNSIYKTTNKPKIEFNKETTKLSILDHRLFKNGKRIYILGSVKNEDSVRWNNIYVRAEYFDKAGNLVDRSYDIIQIDSGETQDYKVEFHDYDKSDSKLYEKYEVKITSATHYN